MFEKWRIKEHMEVADSTGRHLGTVDEVEDNRIKLTRADSTDGSHHYLDWDSVDRIEDNRVYLKQGTPLPEQSRESVTTGAGSAGAGGGSSANFGGTQGASDLPGTNDHSLFGTSGHGTGMGGSGAR